MSRGGQAAGSWRRFGLRREVMILLPVVLLLLVVLSLFTLFSYRNAVAQLLFERRAEASRLAQAAALRLARESSPGGSQEALRLLEPIVRGAALLDAQGQVRLAIGELPSVSHPLPSVLPHPRRWDDLALDDETGETVAGTAPFGPAADRLYVRVDLAAESLAAQGRALRVLTPSVLVLDAALVLLALLFLRHLMAPYETLLARARHLGVAGGEEDELQSLLSAFERAVQALGAKESAAESEGDLAALERTLSTSLLSGLLLLDRRGELLALNPLGARLLGVVGAPQGRSLDELLAGEPELREILAAAVEKGEAPSRQECSLAGGPNGPLTVGLTVHPLRRDDGAVRGFLILFADLTETRRQAEERRLADSLAQLGELAGGVAHELRNSLATLRGYLTLIERRPDEESLDDYLSEIRREADHLGRVLEDFLAFARPGSARAEVLPFSLLLERAAADPQLAGIPVRVSIASPLDTVQVRVDPQLIERALRNLLYNAGQAEREAGRSGPIDLTARLGAEGVEITVEDRGPGILPEIRDRLFHPFVTGRRGGVGLGLALTQRIVVLHGGRVRLEDRDGGGARAVLLLPSDIIVTLRSAPPSVTAPEAAPSTPR